jgi:two-component system sensor histidine kinase RegB
MPQFNSSPDLLQEIDEMQAQVTRCKGIVGGILLSAGEARGESPAETTVRTFLDDLIAEWRATRSVVPAGDSLADRSVVPAGDSLADRSVGKLSYENRFGDDLTIVSDSALKQMIYNVLDNAVEASPSWVGFDVSREKDLLKIVVKDAGPGFPHEILAQLGKPYQSTKGRPGAGLGLFLVANVARTLGGRVVAQNRLEGGAMVTLTLPLSALTLEDEESTQDGD